MTLTTSSLECVAGFNDVSNRRGLRRCNFGKHCFRPDSCRKFQPPVWGSKIIGRQIAPVITMLSVSRGKRINSYTCRRTRHVVTSWPPTQTSEIGQHANKHTELCSPLKQATGMLQV